MGIYKNAPRFEHCKEAWGASDEKNWINKFKELRRNDDYFLKSSKGQFPMKLPFFVTQSSPYSPSGFSTNRLTVYLCLQLLLRRSICHIIVVPYVRM